MELMQRALATAIETLTDHEESAEVLAALEAAYERHSALGEGPSARLRRAIEVAADAHATQLDKAGAPYLLHPLHVMQSVAHHGESAMVVAVLHDYFEDCAEHAANCDLTFLTEEERDALDRLTHVEGDDYLDTYLERILGSRLATIVKGADLAHNLDLSRRIDRPFTEADLDRCNRYRLALTRVRASLGSGAALAE